MKNLAFPKKLLAAILSLLMVCTMLNCILLTATAEDETIDTLIAAVNADSAVTLDEAEKVNKISVMYDALADQSAYTDTVTALKSSLYTLLSEGQAVLTDDVSKFNKDYWNAISTVDSAVRVKYTGGTNPTIVFGPHAQGKTTVAAADTALDGLEVMINNYYQFDKSAPRAGFSVQFTSWKYQNSGVNYIRLDDTSVTGLVLFFDLKNNQILINSRLVAGGAMNVGTLALSDADKAKLTVANFEHKAISVGMYATGDAEKPYKAVIKLSGDATPIVAYIPAEHYSDAGVTNSGKVCIGFTAGYWTSATTFPTGNICTQFDVIGYRNNKTAQATVDSIESKLAAVDADNVKESDAKVINEMLDAYDTLSVSWDKAHAPYAKISALKASLLSAAKEGLTTFAGTSDFTSDYWNGFITYVDGVARFTINGDGLSPAKRIGIKSAQKFDGLELKFARLRTTSASATAIGVGLQFGTVSGADLSGTSASGLFLYLDAKNGKVYLASKNSGTVTGTALVTDSALLYENIKDRVFTIGINATGNADNPYKLTVKVAGGGTVEANIPAAYITPSLFMNSVANGTTYVAYTRGGYGETGTLPGNSYQTVDMVGYRNTANLFKVENLIAAIPEEVALNDSKTIYAAETAYGALTDYEKTLVDATRINIAKAAYEQLVLGELTEDHVKAEDKVLPAENKLATINGWWGGNFASEVTTGIRVNWANNHVAHRLSVGTPVNMDGLSILFNRLHKTGSSDAVFSILFSRNSSNYYTGGHPHFAVVVNTAKGTLTVSTKGDKNDDYSIITSDLLKYENIADRLFKVDFAAAGEGEYKVTVTVDGASVSGYIPAEAFADVADQSTENAYCMPNPNHCSFAVAAWNSGTYQQLDLVGFKTEEVQQAAKIEGASLTISDSIEIDYKVSAGLLANNVLHDPYITFNFNGKKLDVEGELDSNGMYSFTFPNVAPNMMSKTIYSTLYAYNADNDLIQVTAAVEYSVEQYCYSTLEKYADNKELCDLVTDLLRYGAASQTYTGDDAEGLVTDALTESQKGFGSTYTPATAGKVALSSDASYTAAGKQVTWNSASLYLLDVANIRFKFTVKDGVDVSTLTVKATVGGNEYTVSADRIEQIGNSNSYYLYFDGATAVNMRDDVTVAFYNGETAVSKTATYSIEKYIGTQVDKNADANLVAMLKALLCYGDSATAYAN